MRPTMYVAGRDAALPTFRPTGGGSKSWYRLDRNRTPVVTLDPRHRLPATLSLLPYVPPFLLLFLLLISKVSLASRFDSYGNDPSGHVGRQWRAEVEDKIEKWQEMQTAKTKKALPKPDDMPARKRGGRRYGLRRVSARFFFSFW